MGEIDLAAVAEQSYETLKANLPVDKIMTDVIETTWLNRND